MSEQTPGPQRALTETTPVRLSVRSVLALLGTIVAISFAAAVWAANVQHDIADLRAAVERVEVAVGVRTLSPNHQGPMP